MGRRPNPQRKIDLLDEIVDYVADNGLSDMSLRPLAKALGTSTYTLTYQFGSKEEMVIDLISHAEKRHQATMNSLATDGTPRSTVEAMWEASSDESGKRWNRLLLEMVTMIAREPNVYDRFDGATVRQQIDRISDMFRRTALPNERADVAATLLNATIQGLVVDLLATGDRTRIEEAIARLIDMIDTLTSEQPESVSA